MTMVERMAFEAYSCRNAYSTSPGPLWEDLGQPERDAEAEGISIALIALRDMGPTITAALHVCEVDCEVDPANIFRAAVDAARVEHQATKIRDKTAKQKAAPAP